MILHPADLNETCALLTHESTTIKARRSLPGGLDVLVARHAGSDVVILTEAVTGGSLILEQVPGSPSGVHVSVRTDGWLLA